MGPTLPHIRFWQGFADPQLSEIELATALQKVLIPMTIEVGAQRGLIGYTPLLIQKHSAIPLPDEAALVIYRNEELYKAIRATPEGTRYGHLHFKLDNVKTIPGMQNLEGRDFFLQNNGKGGTSGSAIAQTVDAGAAVSDTELGFILDDIKYGMAFSPQWGETALWQSGAVLARVFTRKPEISDNHYRDSLAYYLKRSASLKDLNAHVVRVEKNYVIEYLFGRNNAHIIETVTDMDDVIEDGGVLDLHQTDFLPALSHTESQRREFPLARYQAPRGYQLRFPID